MPQMEPPFSDPGASLIAKLKSHPVCPVTKAHLSDRQTTGKNAGKVQDYVVAIVVAWLRALFLAIGHELVIKAGVSYTNRWRERTNAGGKAGYDRTRSLCRQ